MSKDILDELANAYSFLRDPWIGKGIDEIARLRRLLEGRWQPIETAPKSDDICNPIKVLVYGIREGELSGLDDEPKVWKAYWSSDAWSVSGGDYYAAWVRSPTHWMPLPEPPNA
jgi:hypothetical protein